MPRAPYIPLSFQPSTGGVDAGECDAPVKFTWPSEVDDFKARLQTIFDATDRTVIGCASLPAEQRKAWNNFYAAWRTFRVKETPTFGSYNDWVTTCTYAKTLDGWRETIKNAKCPIIGPADIKGYELPTGVEKSLESLATTVKWGMLGLGGLILLVTFWPEIRGALGAARAVTRRK